MPCWRKLRWRGRPNPNPISNPNPNCNCNCNRSPNPNPNRDPNIEWEAACQELLNVQTLVAAGKQKHESEVDALVQKGQSAQKQFDAQRSSLQKDLDALSEECTKWSSLARDAVMQETKLKAERDEAKTRVQALNEDGQG